MVYFKGKTELSDELEYWIENEYKQQYSWFLILSKIEPMMYGFNWFKTSRTEYYSMLIPQNLFGNQIGINVLKEFSDLFDRELSYLESEFKDRIKENKYGKRYRILRILKPEFEHVVIIDWRSERKFKRYVPYQWLANEYKAGLKVEQVSLDIFEEKYREFIKK